MKSLTTPLFELFVQKDLTGLFLLPLWELPVELLFYGTTIFFEGKLLEVHRSAIKIHFHPTHNSEKWTLINVYGPCRGPERDDFVKWLHDLDIPLHEH